MCRLPRLLLSFQSTLPTRGSDSYARAERGRDSRFNPRSPRGGATMMSCVSASLGRFQSTLPTRGSDDVPHFALGEAVPISIHAPHEGERPAPPVDINDLAANFNPRSPRGGATKFAQAVATGFYISIHAPHEGERLGAVSTYRRGKAISIHAPHEGERPSYCLA